VNLEGGDLGWGEIFRKEVTEESLQAHENHKLGRDWGLGISRDFGVGRGELVLRGGRAGDGGLGGGFVGFGPGVNLSGFEIPELFEKKGNIFSKKSLCLF